jgi:hypothetical protein
LLFGPIDALVDAAREAADAGFASMWLAQAFGVDAMTAIYRQDLWRGSTTSSSPP